MIAPHVKTFIFIGILGAFTTFSTYMLETLNLFRDGETGLALYNLLLNNFFGIIVVFSGFFLSQALINLFKQG
jgi:CrcB protein